MPDLKSHRLIYLKGILFLVIGILCSVILLVQSPHWQTAVLLCLSIWSFCRFYYFAFYVIRHYVDDQYRFAGLWDFLLYVFRTRRTGTEGAGINDDTPAGDNDNTTRL